MWIFSIAKCSKEHYPDYSYKRVSVYPSNNSTEAASATETYALTYQNLARLIDDARKVIIHLCEKQCTFEELQSECSQILNNSPIFHKNLARYLEKFIIVPDSDG